MIVHRAPAPSHCTQVVYLNEGLEYGAERVCSADGGPALSPLEVGWTRSWAPEPRQTEYS